MTLPTAPGAIPAAFAGAWEARDAAALSRLFADDADFVNVVGIWWEDRHAIEKAHHYGLTTFFRDSSLKVGRVKVRLLGPDHAVVHARLRLSGQLTPDGSRADSRQTILSLVAERHPEGWQVVSAHNTDIVPGAETHLNTGGSLEPRDYRD